MTANGLPAPQLIDRSNQSALVLTVALTDEQLEAIADRVAVRLAGRDLPPADGGYLDADGAAVYLSTSRGRIYDLVQVRKLDPRRDGRRLLFRRADLDAYLERAA